MNHLEAIVHINNLINDDFCNEIIDSYKNFNLKYLPTWGGVKKNERNVLGCNVHSKKDPFNKIKERIERFYIYYKNKISFY